MTPKRKIPPLLAEEDHEAQMQAVLSHLNEKAGWREEMRRLVAAWDASGRDVRKMLEHLPELKPYVYPERGHGPWSAVSVPVGSGLQFILSPPEILNSFDPKRTAADLIIDHERRFFLAAFLKNPLREKLAGPCGWKNCNDKCPRYFIPVTKRRPKYCCRRCCQLDTSTAFTKNRLREEHKDKLDRARAAIQLWIKQRRNEPWKTYVHKREPDITSKFLTRAVTNAELQEPAARKK